MCSSRRRGSSDRTHPDMPAVLRALEQLEEGVGARCRASAASRSSTGVPGGGFAPPFSLEGADLREPEDERPRAAQIAVDARLLRRARHPACARAVSSRRPTRQAPRRSRSSTRRLPRGISPAVRRSAGGFASATTKQPWITIVGVVPSVVQAQQPGQIVESSICRWRRRPSAASRSWRGPAAIRSHSRRAVRAALAAVSAGNAARESQLARGRVLAPRAGRSGCSAGSS